MSEAQGKVNLQNLPKNESFLKCLIADPGHKIVYMDFSALEPHVCTFYSRDEKMMSLYGKGAKKNDIYLFFGSSTKVYGKQIAAAGYDPDDPTSAALKAAKASCGPIRDVLKTVVLGCTYGMGFNLLHSYVNQAGYPLSLTDAKVIHTDYWNFFGGIKRFEKRLLREYNDNHGYILNGRGRPLTIYYKKTKDIVNRFVQSTGHDILMYYIYTLQQIRRRDSIQMRPWMLDEHDSTTWQTPDEHVDQVVAAYDEALVGLNKMLVSNGWDITFNGEIKVGTSMAVKL